MPDCIRLHFKAGGWSGGAIANWIETGRQTPDLRTQNGASKAYLCNVLQVLRHNAVTEGHYVDSRMFRALDYTV